MNERTFTVDDELDHQTYNKRVQEAMRLPCQYRVRKSYHDEQLVAAYFEVFYDRWRILGGEQHPFTPEVRRWFDDIEYMKVLCEIAGSV